MTRRTRLSLAFAAALLAAAVIVLVVALLTHGAARTPPPVRAGAGQSARQSARAACRDMADVETLTRQDAAATRVLRYLRIAAADSGAAVARDSTWRSLESGIVALQQSITANNGSLASTGIAIVHDQCATGGEGVLQAFGDVLYVSTGLMKAASTLGYDPEWIASGVGDMGDDDADSEWSEGPGPELDHLIGIGPWSKYLAAAQEPWVEAYEAETSNSPTAIQSSEDEDVYHDLLMLASGIQAAGPNLTPTTFAAALKAESFPNPGAGAAPFYQATVGFGSGTDEMEQDYAAWSWSTSTATQAPGPSEGLGASCDVESGARYSLNTWPTTPLPFFASGQSCY